LAAREPGLTACHRLEVEEVEEVVGIGVAVRHRREVPLALEEGEDGGVVVDDVADVVALGVGTDQDGRDAEAVPREGVVRRLARSDLRRIESGARAAGGATWS
jgi:hypothetical protein